MSKQKPLIVHLNAVLSFFLSESNMPNISLYIFLLPNRVLRACHFLFSFTLLFLRKDVVIFVHFPCQFLIKFCYLLINEENRSDDGFTWSTPPFINLGLLIFVFRLSDTFPHGTNFVPVLIGLLLLGWVRNQGQQRTAAGMQALKEVTIYSQMKGSSQQTFHGL